MSQIDFFNKNIFFTTRQYALSLGIPIATASRQLKKLDDSNSIQSVTRGIWAQMNHPFYSPYGVVPYILGNEQGYVSFLTALHRHDVISQIPKVIQIATTGHGRKLFNKLGEFELFHIQPSLMQNGVNVHDGKLVYNMATAEKSLIDTLYISTRKGNRFSKFPELNWDAIDKKKLKQMISHLKPNIQKLINKKLKSL